MTGPVGDDAFRSYDAAYVLGALNPTERHEYEQHLAECPHCRESVRALAGLPGLMSRVRPEDFTTPEEAPPPELLPAMLNVVARRRRRARWCLAAVGAAAAAVVLVLVLLLVNSPGPAPAPPARPMAAVVASPVHATVSLRDQPWGTDVTLRCHYDGTASYPGGYTLVVVDDAGRAEQIAAWKAVPATTAVLTGTTSVSRHQIRAIQVRTPTGTAILNLTV